MLKVVWYEINSELLNSKNLKSLHLMFCQLSSTENKPAQFHFVYFSRFEIYFNIIYFIFVPFLLNKFGLSPSEITNQNLILNYVIWNVSLLDINCKNK